MQEEDETARANVFKKPAAEESDQAVVTNPYNIIVLIAVVLLVYLIVLPLLDMIATTFELAQRDIRAVGGGKAGRLYPVLLAAAGWPVSCPGPC